MDHKIRLKSRLKSKEYTEPPEITLLPIGLIDNYFIDDEDLVESSLTDLYHYLHLQCSDDEFEKFCEIFPYDEFLDRMISFPECPIRQKALMVFSCCATSDFFPSEQYSTDMDVLSFFYSFLDSPIRDEVSSALQILAYIMFACPQVCEFLVETQKLHAKLSLIEATPQFAKVLAILCEVHPESLELTLSLIPYCLQTHNSQTISFALLAMISSLKNEPESAAIIISFVDEYAINLFSFDVYNIEESDPQYPDEIVNPESPKESSMYNEENIQLLLEIISIVPEAPASLFIQVYNVLLKCKLVDTILLCNLALRNQKNNWRGDEFIDFMLCATLQGIMEDQTYEVQKSCFKTISVYYQWDVEVNNKLNAYLIHFLEDEDMRFICLFILSSLIDFFITKGPDEDFYNHNDEQSLTDLCDIIVTAIPSIEKIINDPNVNEENETLAQNILKFIQSKATEEE